MSSLQFVLKAPAAKGIHDALICLSKFSEYVMLEAWNNRLVLSSLNLSKTAYGAVTLAGPEFFEKYQFTASSGMSTDDEDSRFTCRLYAKALLAVFRQRYSEKSDTAIKKCEVTLENDPSRPECRLHAQLICKHGVLKTYKLTYEEVDVRHPRFDMGLAVNRWTIKSRLLLEHMGHFAPKAELFQVSSHNGRAAFTTFTEKITDGKEILKMPMQTNVVLDVFDFESWEVNPEVWVVISHKDMRAIVTHATALNTPLSAFFSEAGKPLRISYEYEGMTCEFTLTTLPSIRVGQPPVAAVTRVVDRRPNPTPIVNSALPDSQMRHQSKSASQGQQPPPHNDEPLFRGATPSQARPTQGTQMQPPPSPPPPPPQPPQAPQAPQESQPPPSPSQIQASRPMTQGLFLPFDSDEDDSDDELARVLDDLDDHGLRWNSNENDETPSIAVARDHGPPTMRRDEFQEDEFQEDDSTIIGPTQGASQARGLFDFR